MESQPITNHEIIQPEIPAKHFNSTLERDKCILERYVQGLRLIDIAKEFNLSEVRISQIVRANKAIIKVDREFEKNRRLHRLRLCENKAPKNLAPKDATELVRVIEAQRKEIEGDGPQVTNNTLIQVKGDITVMSLAMKWDNLRSLMELE